MLRKSIFAFALVAAFALAVTASAQVISTSKSSPKAQIMELQAALNVCNDAGLAEDGVWGPKTLAAVKAFQGDNDLVVDGIVGPRTASALNDCVSVDFQGGTTPSAVLCPNGMTLASNCTVAPTTTVSTEPLCPNGMTLASNCTVAPGTTTTTTTVVGLTGEGTVNDFLVSSPEETDFAEGQNGRELVAFDIELDDDGSLKLDRFDLYMGQDNTVTASNKPWDYFESATLFVNGTEVASMDTDSSSDWSEYDTGTLGTTSQEYRLRFTGMNVILPNDETSEVRVEFDIVSNLDSADEDAVWQFGTTIDSFRFTDATGFVFTDGEDLASSFSADTADVAGLDISASADDPDASVVEVSDTSDTNGVTLGIFEIEEDEGVDVNITEMTITLATSDTITDVVKKLYVYNGSTLVGQEVVTGTTVTFDNIDLDIDGDDTVELTVKADLDDTNSQARYQDGDTVSVSAVNLTAYEDEFGNDENDFTETGSFAGETHTLYVNGIRVELVGTPTTTIITDDNAATFVSTAQFVWVVEIESFGSEDVYINKDSADVVTSSTAGDIDTLFSVEKSGGADLASTTGTVVCTSNCSNVTSVTGDDAAYDDLYDAETFFKLAAGKTATFTITVTGPNQTDSKQIRALLNGIEWTIDNVDVDATYDASTATRNNYTVGLGSDAATPFAFIH